MKILFLTHYDNMYGANRAMYKLIKELKTRMDADITLCIPAEGEMTRAMEEIGVKWFISGGTQWQAMYTSPLRFAVKRHMRLKLIKMESENLYNEFKDKGIDIVHSNSSVTSLGAMLAERLGCHHIWHIREFSKEHFNMRYFYKSSRVKELYEKADYLVTISDSLKENIASKYPGASVVRVYDGVSGDYTPAKGSNDGIFRFVYIGYLFPMKMQAELIEAAKLLRDKGIQSFEVNIVGDGDPKYKAELEALISKYNLDNVKLNGYVSDIHSFLDCMDAGVITSRYEGFGLVTVEYMLHSLPVIGYNGGGTGEIVVNEETGLLYENASELAEKMERLINDKELCHKFGDAGLNRAKEEFTEARNAENLIKIYKEIEAKL